MTKRWIGGMSILVLVLGFSAERATANSTGIFGYARPSVGCNCHGGLIPENTTTQLVLQGLPSDGYVPGESYDLTVWVLGVAVPLGPTLLDRRAGFNLEVTAGSLEAADDRVRIRPANQYFPTWQATHSSTGGIDPVADYTDGNSIVVWSLTWIAPDPGAGEVSFFLAGNVVNADGRNDPGDLWSVLESPMVVPQAE